MVPSAAPGGGQRNFASPVFSRPTSRRSKRLFDRNSLPAASDAADEFENDQSEPRSRAREDLKTNGPAERSADDSTTLCV